jgi:hypothetical protein
MPSTFDVPVVPGEARSAPCSMGTPSKPTCDAFELRDAAAVVELAAGAEVLELELELLPHPASATAVAARAINRWRRFTRPER